jgi:hypothetical protein
VDDKMSDNKKDSASSEIEYQYADGSFGQESLQEPVRRNSAFTRLQEGLSQKLPKSRKFRILFFSAIAIYIIYMFLNVSGKGVGKQTSYKHPSKMTDTNPSPIAPKSLPSKLAKDTQPIMMDTTKIIPKKEVQQETVLQTEKPALGDLNLYNKADANDITPTTATDSVNNTQLKDLQDKLTQLNNTVTNMQAALLNLTESAVQLSNKINSLESKAQTDVKKAEIMPLTIFYLQSLVSGRAWVYSPGGQLLTVKVGDFLPGYGKIRKIDVRAGIISTTSGRLIRYGSNDS